jgi:hypothetical protein
MLAFLMKKLLFPLSLFCAFAKKACSCFSISKYLFIHQALTPHCYLLYSIQQRITLHVYHNLYTIDIKVFKTFFALPSKEASGFFMHNDPVKMQALHQKNIFCTQFL